MNKQLIVDHIGSIQYTPEQINESITKNDGKLIVSGIMQRGSTDSDKNFNQNGRSYPLNILKREADKYKQSFIAERRALGELDHPESQVVNLSNVSHNIVDLWFDGTDLMGKIEILSTPSGNIARELLKAGIRLGTGDFEIVCWDLVSNPSTQGAFMTNLHENKGNKNAQNQYSKINTLISDIISIM